MFKSVAELKASCKDLISKHNDYPIMVKFCNDMYEALDKIERENRENETNLIREFYSSMLYELRVTLAMGGLNV